MEVQPNFSRIGLGARSREMAGAARRGPVSMMGALFLVSISLPSEIAFRVGDLSLPAYRLYLLIAFGFAGYRILASGTFRWHFADVLVAIYAGWTLLCFFASADAGRALQAGGSSFLDCSAYFVARTSIRDIDGMTRVTIVTLWIMVIVAPVALSEFVSGSYLLHGAFGTHEVATLGRRLGFSRAMGPFEHPILYGTFCASAASGSWLLLGQRMRWGRAAFVAASVFMSLSAAPLLATVVQYGLIAWDRTLSGLRNRWTMILVAALAGFLVIELTSNRGPVHVLIGYMTLDPNSGWVRLAQWNFGWQTAEQHWLLGLGYSDWTRPAWLGPSVDSFWLHTAMKFGFSGFFLLVALTVAAMASIGFVDLITKGSEFENARKAWMFTLISMVLVGITVDYWQQMNAYYFFALGSGMWLMDIETNARRN